jgi:DNA repair protein RecN (Recombination protein N)
MVCPIAILRSLGLLCTNLIVHVRSPWRKSDDIVKLPEMLRSLRIQNLALIDDLTLEFGEGLNLLTGETGSGKSIIVDSLGFILGRRGSTEIIRSGAEAARVEAEMDAPALLCRRLLESGIEVEPAQIGSNSKSAATVESSLVIFRREITTSGKSRAWINQSPVTIGFLQELAPLLADIHGQQDQQLLQMTGLHVDLLDQFGGHGKDCAEVRAAFAGMKELEEKLRSVTLAEAERLQRLDFLQFQIREIEELRLEPGEEEQLLREKNLLTHGEELLRLSGEIFEWLYNTDDSALSLLARSIKNLQRLASIDPKLAPLESAAGNARYSLEDLAYQMRDYSQAIDFDPSRLQQIELRLERIDRLKKKYGNSIAEILDLLAGARVESGQLANWEASREKLKAEHGRAQNEFERRAEQLSQKRKKAAARLQKELEHDLKSLAMERARFLVDLRRAEASSKGYDRVEFLISANTGEQPRPLARIASGGELSRLMLGLKSLLHGSGTEVLVFDEVDAGIGGRVAETVGEKLKRLAARHQVFCITHLPQIAAFGDVHYCVEKEVVKGRTVVTATRLNAEGKLQEVARMLAGSQVGKSALDHARSLISRSSPRLVN